MTLAELARGLVLGHGELLDQLRGEVEVRVKEVLGGCAPVRGRDGHEQLTVINYCIHNVYVTVDDEEQLWREDKEWER